MRSLQWPSVEKAPNTSNKCYLIGKQPLFRNLREERIQGWNITQILLLDMANPQ